MDPDKPFLLRRYASDRPIRAVLEQEKYGVSHPV